MSELKPRRSERRDYTFNVVVRRAAVTTARRETFSASFIRHSRRAVRAEIQTTDCLSANAGATWWHVQSLMIHVVDVKKKK